MTITRLGDLAATLRSKNAGVDQITFDIIFRDRPTYERVVASGAVTAESICRLFGIGPERIAQFVFFELANAIKFTIWRSQPNGSPGDWDVLGCQYYGPLVDLPLPP